MAAGTGLIVNVTGTLAVIASQPFAELKLFAKKVVVNVSDGVG